MKCREFETRITDLLHGELDESKRREALAHAAACKQCGAVLENERRLTAEFHALAAGQGAEQAPAPIEQQLAAAFRAHSAGRAASTTARSESGRSTGLRISSRLRDFLLPAQKWWLWGTASAGVMLGVLFFASLPHRPAVNPVTAVSKPRSTAPMNAKHDIRVPETPLLGASQPAGAAPERVAAVKRARQQPPARRAAGRPSAVEVEVATGFYTIPYVEPVGPEESIRVVRTRVPRYWLTALGLPVNNERAFDPIQADVLVGEDNVARAIRFVQQWQVPQNASRPARSVPVNARYVP